MQSRSDLHPVASALRELAVDLDPGAEGLVADRLFERVDMEPYGRDATLLIEAQRPYKGDADLSAKRAMGAKAQPIRGGDTNTKTIAISEYALSYFCDRLEIVDDQLPGSAEERAMKRLTRTLALKRENRAADLLFQAATGWTNAAVSALTGGGGAKWNTATGTPLSDLQIMQELFYDASGGFYADTLVIPWKVIRALGKNNEVRNVLVGSGSATSVSRAHPVTDNAVVSTLAAVLGMPEGNIIVPGFRQDTANPGASASYGDIWTDNVWMGVLRGSEYEQRRSGVRMNPMAAADFRYSDVEIDVNDSANPKGREMVISEIHDYKLVEASLGYLATDAL